ncbi:unnamed protein product [Paramecium primaurelia]|uniref:Uncharacterized protein n=1 Tax=Paramecium primaurelia TaxID=5886 RepID=A0A8S1K2M1_PARPR|nr:unnamed protein product [Paramecium primaurelia]
MDQQKSELYDTALFRKFHECLESQNELEIYQNTHTDKFYKAMPCTIKPKKIKNNPIIMAQMLSKKIVYKEQNQSIEMNYQESNRSRGCTRFSSPSRNDERQQQIRSLIISRRENQRCPSIKQDVFKKANEQLNHNIFDLPKKIRTPKYSRAELYFSSHLRDSLRTPRNGIKIPQYLANKIKYIK